MSHSPRYTKLVLIDNEGNEVLRAPQGIGSDPRFGTPNHTHTDYFKGASQLGSRDLYISPPGRNLQYELFSGEVIPVVNVTTPVFDADGERRGVVMLSLNWQHLTQSLYQSMRVDPEANVLLVDVQGRWLLTQAPISFQAYHSAVITPEPPQTRGACCRENSKATSTLRTGCFAFKQTTFEPNSTVA